MMHMDRWSPLAPDIAVLVTYLGVLRHRASTLRDERGMTTETVIITAGLGALAVALVVIIGNRVRARANAIP